MWGKILKNAGKGGGGSQNAIEHCIRIEQLRAAPSQFRAERLRAHSKHRAASSSMNRSSRAQKLAQRLKKASRANLHQKMQKKGRDLKSKNNNQNKKQCRWFLWFWISSGVLMFLTLLYCVCSVGAFVIWFGFLWFGFPPGFLWLLAFGCFGFGFVGYFACLWNGEDVFVNLSERRGPFPTPNRFCYHRLVTDRAVVADVKGC